MRCCARGEEATIFRVRVSNTPEPSAGFAEARSPIFPIDPSSDRPRRRTMQVASSKFALPLGLALLVTACGGDGAPATGGLEGGDADLAWTTEEAYTLGGYQAIDWDAFGDVDGIGFDDEGNLHILDTQAARVHVVAPSGELIRSFGTQGEGPGELNRPESMVVFPDGSLAVYDFGKFGWVRYDAQGEWVEDVTFDNSGSMQLLGN